MTLIESVGIVLASSGASVGVGSKVSSIRFSVAWRSFVAVPPRTPRIVTIAWAEASRAPVAVTAVHPFQASSRDHPDLHPPAHPGARPRYRDAAHEIDHDRRQIEVEGGAFGNRPLLDTDDPRGTLEALLAARSPAYAEADVVIPVAAADTLDNTVAAVRSAVEARMPDMFRARA